MPSFGVMFTWSNNRSGDAATYEKLDRAMGNAAWSQMYPKAALLILPIFRSDHSPIILDTHWQQKSYQRIWQFVEAWVGIDAVRQIAKKVWDVLLNGSFAFEVIQKQKMLLRHLANWKKLSIGYLTEEIESRKRQLEKIQAQLGGQHCGLETKVIIKQDLLVRRELEDLLACEEVYWA